MIGHEKTTNRGKGMSLSKEAMMEYVKPGSGVPLETMLEAFGKACNGTNRASFTITRNVRTGKWKVSFSTMRNPTVFENASLREAIWGAGEWLINNRVKNNESWVLKNY
jgi:hypothetical protein